MRIYMPVLLNIWWSILPFPLFLLLGPEIIKNEHTVDKKKNTINGSNLHCLEVIESIKSIEKYQKAQLHFYAYCA